MTSTPHLSTPLTLPCGQVLPNRMVKAAMSEGMGSPQHRPTEALIRLTQRLAQGGVGLQLTGNIMIDRQHLGEPGNVVVEDERDHELLSRWAEAARGSHGGRIWGQINHPGKQSPKFINLAPVGPSAVPFGPPMDKAFAVPRALTEPEIEEIIVRFANTSAVLQRAGFDGIQLHAAHGYLLSQFLSGHHNRRTDHWGGPIENRSRLLLETVRAVRDRVGPHFALGVKINSADFQRGGFTEAESTCVIRALEQAGVDMVEVSGGNYEAPAMTGAALQPDGERQAPREPSSAREGYFLRFADQIRAEVRLPLCVTGGFHSAAGIQSALDSGATDLVGIARLLAVDPDFPQRALTDPGAKGQIHRPTTGWKVLDQIGMLQVTYYANQLARMGRGQPPDPTLGGLRSLLETLLGQGRQAFALRRAR